MIRLVLEKVSNDDVLIDGIGGFCTDSYACVVSDCKDYMVVLKSGEVQAYVIALKPKDTVKGFCTEVLRGEEVRRIYEDCYEYDITFNDIS